MRGEGRGEERRDERREGRGESREERGEERRGEERRGEERRGEERGQERGEERGAVPTNQTQIRLQRRSIHSSRGRSSESSSTEPMAKAEDATNPKPQIPKPSTVKLNLKRQEEHLLAC